MSSLSRLFGFFLLVGFVHSALAFKDSPEAVQSTPKGADEVLTNSALFKFPPKWFGKYKAEQVINRVERKLEWSTRRVTVTFYKDQASFDKAFTRDGSRVLAFARRNDHTVHIGPRVDKNNFEMVFSHELAHVIMFQKYKDRIPAWLEEGMANFVADNTRIDYEWLANQKRVPVKTLDHPLDARSTDEVDFKYMAALATILMLKKQCPDFRELLNLSLKENLQTFVPTYCQIPDLDKALWAFVDKNKTTNKWTRQ